MKIVLPPVKYPCRTPSGKWRPSGDELVNEGAHVEQAEDTAKAEAATTGDDGALGNL